MKQNLSCRSRLLLVALIGVLSLAGCAKIEQTAAKAKDPFVLEPIEGTDLVRLLVEPATVKRTAVKTGKVDGLVRFGSESEGRRIPYASVLYLPDGTTFVYTNPLPNTYVRAPIAVDYIEGQVAVLTSGPEPGTKVVTDGAAELWGMEFGVGK